MSLIILHTFLKGSGYSQPLNLAEMCFHCIRVISSQSAERITIVGLLHSVDCCYKLYFIHLKWQKLGKVNPTAVTRARRMLGDQ